MPTYCYTNKKTGETIDHTCAFADRPDKIRRNGMVFHRDVEAEMGGVRATPCGIYPMYSETLGVGENPADIARARAAGQHVDDRGRMVIKSAEHRKEVCRQLGVVDMN